MSVRLVAEQETSQASGFVLGVVVARPDLDGVARLDWRALFDGDDA